MKYLKRFIEARLFDLINIKGESDIEKKVKSFQDMDFDMSHKLINYIPIKGGINGKNATLRVFWNDTTMHSLSKRIDNRTGFISVEEFNEYFSEVINQLIPQEIGNKIDTSGKYSIYDDERKFSIVFYIDFKGFLNEKYRISVITILPGKKGKDIVRFLEV